MSNRLLLDTNIVLDYLARREPFFSDARKLMILGAIAEVELCFSALQLTDAFYILSNGGKAACGIDAQDKLKQCRRFIRICGITEQDIDKAFELRWNDLEDAFVAVCADKHKADYIISRDSEFQTAGIPVLSPAEYFKRLETERGLTYAELTLGMDTAV